LTLGYTPVEQDTKLKVMAVRFQSMPVRPVKFDILDDGSELSYDESVHSVTEDLITEFLRQDIDKNFKHERFHSWLTKQVSSTSLSSDDDK